MEQIVSPGSLELEWMDSSYSFYRSFELRTIKLWGCGPQTYTQDAEVREERKKQGGENPYGSGGTELGRQQGQLPLFLTAF